MTSDSVIKDGEENEVFKNNNIPYVTRTVQEICNYCKIKSNFRKIKISLKFILILCRNSTEAGDITIIILMLIIRVQIER